MLRREFAGYDPTEIVYLNGVGPMTLRQAVNIAISSRRHPSVSREANVFPERKPAPIIFRRRGRKPQILELRDIEEIVSRL